MAAIVVLKNHNNIYQNDDGGVPERGITSMSAAAVLKNKRTKCN